MGNSRSRQPAPVVARCIAPAYCAKVVGSRHLLLGGGGGAAKTGVPNQIQSFLLTCDERRPTAQPPSKQVALIAKLADAICTDPHATMNMDCVCLGAPDLGNYILAAGHDQFCDIYESKGFVLSKPDDESEQSLLNLSFEKISRITTDEKAVGAYQKTVRFDRCDHMQRLFTGGADGCIRVWDLERLRKKTDTDTIIPLLKIDAYNCDVDDLDVSYDGKICASVGHNGDVFLWDTYNGKKLHKLIVPSEIGEDFRVRSVRFTNLGTLNTIFVVIYNQIRRTPKSISHVGLWAFNRERSACQLILVKNACSETISTLAVSECGNFFAIGTLSGSVGIFDTHDLKRLYYARETHGIFVTGIEFLPRKTLDFGWSQDSDRDNRPRRIVYPGVLSEFRVSILSLSADQTVQVHSVPHANTTTFTTTLLRLSLLTAFVYCLIWYLCDRLKVVQ